MDRICRNDKGMSLIHYTSLMSNACGTKVDKDFYLLEEEELRTKTDIDSSNINSPRRRNLQ